MSKIANLYRQVSDLSRLSIIDDFRVDEILKADEGDYKVIQTELDKILTVEHNTGSTINNKWNAPSVVDLDVGDTIEVSIIGESLDDVVGTTDQFLFKSTDNTNLRVVVGEGSGSSFRCIRIGSNIDISVTDEDGVDRGTGFDLPLNKRNDVTITANQAITFNGLDFVNFTNANHKIKVLSFAITKGVTREEFNFNTVGDSFTGDDGTTFTYSGTGVVTKETSLPTGVEFKVYGTNILQILPDKDGKFTLEQLGYNSLRNNDEGVDSVGNNFYITDQGNYLVDDVVLDGSENWYICTTAGTVDSLDYSDLSAMGGAGTAVFTVYDSRDCSYLINKLLADGKGVKLLNRNYYVNNGIYGVIASELDGINSAANATFQSNSVSRIYTDKNIDIITVQSENFNGSKIVIDTSKCIGYTANRFRVDMSFDVREPVWKRMYCIGNEDDLDTLGLGGTSFSIDNDNPTNNRFCNAGDFEFFIYNTDIGLNLPSYTSPAFRNQNKFKFYIDGARQPIIGNQLDLDVLEITYQERDDNFGGTEDTFLPMVLKGRDITLDYRPFDVDGRNSAIARVEVDNLKLTGNSLDANSLNLMDLRGSTLTPELIIENLKYLNIPKSQGFVSKLDNQILLAGESGYVTMSGFKATDQAWIDDDNNIEPADTVFTENTTDILYEQKDSLLKATSFSDITGFRIVSPLTDRDLHFVEINIGYDPLDDTKTISDIQKISDPKMRAFNIRTSGNRVGYFRVIAKFDTGYYTNTLTFTQNADNLFPSDVLVKLINENDLAADSPWIMLDYDNEAVSTFQVDETVTFGGGGVGTIKSFSDNGTTGSMIVEMTSGSNPLDNETIVASTSGTTADVDGDSSTQTYLNAKLERLTVRLHGIEDLVENTKIKDLQLELGDQYNQNDPHHKIAGSARHYGTFEADDFVIDGDGITPVSETGTVINLNKSRSLNTGTPSTASSFTVSNIKLLKTAINFVDTTGKTAWTDYTVTGATHLTQSSDTFQAAKIYRMNVISYDGTTAVYSFKLHE